MLAELSKMQQRYDAVLGVFRDGYSVSEVARAYGVSRQSVHTWLARYEAGGLPALAERSHRPRTSPLQMAPMVEARLPRSSWFELSRSNFRALSERPAPGNFHKRR